MKIKSLQIVIAQLLLALFVSACGTGESLEPTEAVAVDMIYSQVALTLTASNPTMTVTSAPTSTSMPTVVILPTSLLSLTTPAVGSVLYSSASSGAVGCDNSAYVSDVTIPDGTILTPESTFTKTWRLQNTGSCDWTTSYSIVFYSGDAMTGTTTFLGDAVSVGSSGDISVEMTAPSTAGSYTGYWRLQNVTGTSFGEIVYVQIVVSGSVSTPTATSEEATSTPTAVITESTSTPVPTNTPEPTATEIPPSS